VEYFSSGKAVSTSSTSLKTYGFGSLDFTFVKYVLAHLANVLKSNFGTVAYL